MQEVWGVAPIFGGLYEVSTFGRVKAKARVVRKHCGLVGKVVNQNYKERLLSTKPFKNGYCNVHLGLNGKDESFHVGRLVLMTFVGPCPKGMECCHNDGDQSNNRIDNLRWDTHFNNNQDRKKHGNYFTGEDHPMAKLTNKQILEIRESPLSGSLLSKLYGVGQSQISRIKRRLSCDSI